MLGAEPVAVRESGGWSVLLDCNGRMVKLADVWRDKTAVNRRSPMGDGVTRGPVRMRSYIPQYLYEGDLPGWDEEHFGVAVRSWFLLALDRKQR